VGGDRASEPEVYQKIPECAQTEPLQDPVRLLKIQELAQAEAVAAAGKKTEVTKEMPEEKRKGQRGRASVSLLREVVEESCGETQGESCLFATSSMQERLAGAKKRSWPSGPFRGFPARLNLRGDGP